MRRLGLIAILCPALAFAHEAKPCIKPTDASQYLNKDICISVHIYDVVRLEDGTRFLDVCSPETPDTQCRFTVVSRPEDSDAVGELNQYRDADVHVRGIVESMHGRSGMVLSHARQFFGGPPKFRPNPRLIRGFAADSARPAVNDPNLRSHGGRRGFMNSNDRETRPTQ
jgi:hypothetical protein